MTGDEIEAVLAQLQAAYPAQAEKLTNDVYALWANTLDRENADAVFNAVERWIATEEWWPSVARLREMIREERDDLPELPSTVRCDGTGWLPGSEEQRPCPTCSPAMFAIWRDPKKLRLFREGRPLRSILGKNREEFAEEYDRQPCPPIDVDDLDPELFDCPPDRGRAIARAAYEAYCEREGREPNPKALERIGGL